MQRAGLTVVIGAVAAFTVQATVLAGTRTIPSFKTVCTFTSAANNDPIVFPNQPGASHRHDFFGAVSTGASSTADALSTMSTSCDFSEDHSAYWSPSLLNNGVPIAPDHIAAYYKVDGSDPTKVQPMPFGLEMIVGDSKATAPQPTANVAWLCSPNSGAASKSAATATIPTCAADQHLSLRLVYPQCWDGQDLDSPDHKSHMAYIGKAAACPPDHPVLLPTLHQIVHFDGVLGGPQYTLASGGQLTGHGDFINAWDPDRMAQLVDTCLRDGQVCRDSSVRVTGGEAVEGSPVAFKISLGDVAASPVTISYATTDMTAQAGTDYTATSGSITIPKGSSDVTVSVPTSNDGAPEGSETFGFNLISSDQVSVAGAGAVGTITDGGAVPAVSLYDATIAEPATQPQNVVCVLQLDNPATSDVVVDYATVNGSATAGPDYAANAGTATIPAGATSRTIAVTVYPDSDSTEGNEQFSIVLSNPRNATLGHGTATVTITDAVNGPKLSVSDASASEGNDELVMVSLSEKPSSAVTVDYRAVSGSATEGSDFVATSGKLTIAAGATAGIIKVPTIDNGTPEPDERFQVVLSNAVGATLVDDTSSVLIIDDDGLPTLQVFDASVVEPTTGTRLLKFTVSLSRPTDLTVSFDWYTVDCTATAGSDYAANGGTTKIKPGSTSKTLLVQVNADNVAEAAETLQVMLTNVHGATLAKSVGVGTIFPPS